MAAPSVNGGLALRCLLAIWSLLLCNARLYALFFVLLQANYHRTHDNSTGDTQVRANSANSDNNGRAYLAFLTYK